MNFKQTVKLSHFEGGLYALMVASTESFLFYYAVKQNISSFQLALLATLPLALGALSQILVPKFISDKHLGSSVVWTMLFQIIGVIGILYTVAVHYSFNQLLFYSCIHFMGGLTSNPLWIDWASRIIPKRNFRKYMARRSEFTWYFILFFYILLAVLGQQFTWFKLVYIFLIGAIARVLSCILQSFIIRGEFSKRITEKAIVKSRLTETVDRQVLPHDLMKVIKTFIILTSFFRLAIYVSNPFFVPYMMNDLKLSMFQFVFLSSIPYFGRAIFFNHWGRIGKNYGAFFSIQVTMLYISFIPIIWIFSHNYTFLVVTEILAGICWGGLELNQVLMIQNFMHQSMKEGSRVLLGIHMACANFLGVIGAVIGSFLLNAAWNFREVFLLSSILRFLTALILILTVLNLKKVELNLKNFKNHLKKLLPH